MIHLYTGNGKGKTTAAAGIAIRAHGQGLSVCFAQFMKGNDTGEIFALRDLGIKILRSEKNFGFFKSMSEEDKKELTVIHDRILDDILKRVRNGRLNMIILDEVTYPVKWELLDQGKLRELIELCHMEKGPELVMTGRDAADFLVDAADYVTEMKEVRHPYAKGVKARRGVEF